MKRQPDGKWRGVRQPVVASESMLRARWVESETICLKRMGLSFDAIGDQITAVGLGKATPMVAIPAGVSFPPDYGITKQACHKAFRKAIKREPSIELDEMRKLDTARSEEMFANLQPAIRKGNPKAIQVGIGVLDHTAKINGYAAPQRIKPLDGEDDRPTIAAIRKILGNDTLDAISLPQLLLMEADNSPSPNRSAVGGASSPKGDPVVPDDDGTELLGVIEWSDIVRVREELDQEEKRMKAFSWLLKI